jgi:glycosyltransferase involved in cell wall biosynthesis
VVAEALACGAAVVVSDLGGPPEYIDDRSNGLVVPAGHVGHLVDVLAELLDDPERAEMGRRSRTNSGRGRAGGVSRADCRRAAP